ncbi:hypothetical protein C1T17_01030 [Sphingobium sp. SCG-1]|uniref:winged helix DNA-binding protein n=1 Tax=Sphingobium sp. SCG-1 TaxID=2072936 RepID=UPI000CD69722|nr:winged helix DNA-binding protein [Sphingobium sp. SCG-1]AUW56866.1 hypothetical protein C1T17_01030 [Sphingobium sp. SCG-1]
MEQSAKLEQLSLEVQRLSRTLDEIRFPARTSSEDPAERRRRPSNDSTVAGKKHTNWSVRSEVRNPIFGNGSAILTAAIVRDLLRARRLRDQFFGGELFADPAWDMILDLMAARLSGERVSVSSLCIAAAVPPTTALRWIRHLTQAGILERRPDTQDGRRVFIALSEKTAAAVHRWYASSLVTHREDGD